MEENVANLNNLNISPLYVYSDSLARFKYNHDNVPIIEIINPLILRHIVCKYIEFKKYNRHMEEIPAMPPMENIKDILAWGNWPGVPILEGVAQIPIIHPDGSIIDTPGYDALTKRIYWPYRTDLHLTVPDIVDKQSVDRATAIIDDLIVDFPFIDDSARDNYIALLITAFSRTLFDDLTPLFLIDSPRAGTGKSLLTSIIGYLATGRYSDSFTQPRDEEEWRKQLSTYLRSGATVLIIDNVDNSITSSNLSKFLTSNLWKDRLLGTNTEICIKNRTLTIANGNNISPGRDITRRCVWIRIDAQEAQPWMRPIEKFKHPRLLQYINENINAILSAIYTCIRYWIQIGKPLGPAYGSYPEWSMTVGGILAACGYDHFLENLYEFQTTIDDEYNEWLSFFAAWYEIYPNIPVSLREIRENTQDMPDFIDSLPEKISGAWVEKSSKSNSMIGWYLRRKIDTIYGDYQLRRDDISSEKHKKYYVKKICKNFPEKNIDNCLDSERFCEEPLTNPLTTSHSDDSFDKFFK